MSREDDCGEGCGSDGAGPKVDESKDSRGAAPDDPPPGCPLPNPGCHFVAVRTIQGNTYCEYECVGGSRYFEPCP